MSRIALETKRPWSWKTFLVLVGLIVPAAFAIVPFSVHQLIAYGSVGADVPGWRDVVVAALVNGLIVSVLGGIGLLVANRIGLGMPFVEGLVKRKPVPSCFQSAVAIAWIAAVGFVSSYLFLQNQVFGPPMLALFEEMGYTVPEEAIAPPFYGFLAAFQAGVTEETVFRLFGLSLLAWVGGLLFRDADGRPKLAVLWTANVLFALAFGAGHLRAAESLGWPINTLIVTRVLVVNGIPALVLGWLFWRFGLETAMLAHFFGDVVLYTFLPIIALQEGKTAQQIAIVGVVGVVLLALFWAWRTLVAENRGQRRQAETKPERIQVTSLTQEPASDCAISIQHLARDFGSVRALDDLCLEVPPGIIFGFLGPNGAGKTTTIRLLLGLLEPTSGTAQVLGYDTRSQADQIRAHTGALLEHSGLYEQMSAEDNLEFYGRAFLMPDVERQARIQELLTRMGLWERRRDRVGTWSRGMKQKLALARTMLHQPRLVLLDEPTAGLDVQAAVSVRQDLAALASREQTTIFLTTHNMVDAEQLCHLVAVIREGKLVALGSPDELRAKASTPQVEVVGRGFTDEALKVLRAHPQVATIHRQDGHLLVDLLEETDTADLVGLLVGVGAQIEEVHRGRASLEQAFLQLTGEQDG
jgi:ABC-2 type transport system ATP-binding protein